jgi:hypothetical protein
MQHALEMDDEEAYEGPDAYIEGDEIEYEVEEQVEALTEGHGSSVQGILRCECSISYLVRHFLKMSFLSSSI